MASLSLHGVTGVFVGRCERIARQPGLPDYSWMEIIVNNENKPFRITLFGPAQGISVVLEGKGEITNGQQAH